MAPQDLSERLPRARPDLGDVSIRHSSAPHRSRTGLGLVQAIAAGDQVALHALYERSHRLVFTLIMRLTAAARRPKR
jgi:hypothetical protein